MIGGGTRSSEMIVPGLVHDHCSAFHPLAAASPFLAGLDLASHGLTWLQPAVDCAHPLDDGSAGVLHRSIDRTAEGLGSDGQRWRRVFEPIASRFDDLLADATQPILRVPRHPLLMARFGAAALLPATTLARVWREEETKALWAGVAAHAFSSPRPSADQRRRVDAARRRARQGVGRRRRRLPGDRRRAGCRHRSARRDHRDGPARDLGRATSRRATC